MKMVDFWGSDDNEPRGLRLHLSPELATVIANAMLTHASSVRTSDVISTTLIQGYDDYIAEEREKLEAWRYGYRKRLGIEDDETEA